VIPENRRDLATPFDLVSWVTFVASGERAMVMRPTTLVVIAILTLCLIDCGSTAPSGPDPGTTGGPQFIVTITGLGVSPTSLTVTPGTQVTFTNNDTATHLMYSDPHPEHTDCPEINQVGALAPGQSRQTGNLNTVRTCGYHDHSQPSNASLRGTIVIR
jgi:plastocyanin